MFQCFTDCCRWLCTTKNEASDVALAAIKPLQLAHLSGGELLVRLEPEVKVTDLVTPEGEFRKEAMTFNHVMIYNAHGTNEQAIVHSATGRYKETRGVTTHDAGKLFNFEGGLCQNTLVFRCIDPLLMPLIEKAAMRWSAIPVTTPHGMRTPKEDSISLAQQSNLVRSLRAAARADEKDVIPLSKTQGVRCAAFATNCMQVAVIQRLFPKGLPPTLRGMLQEIDSQKAKAKVTRFTTLPNIEPLLHRFSEEFDRLLKENPPDLPPALVAMYKDLLTQSTKFVAADLRTLLFAQGLFQVQGLACITDTGTLACLGERADLQVIQAHFAKGVSPEDPLPFARAYHETLPEMDHEAIASLKPGIVKPYTEHFAEIKEAQEIAQQRIRELAALEKILKIGSEFPKKVELQQRYQGLQQLANAQAPESKFSEAKQALLKDFEHELEVHDSEQKNYDAWVKPYQEKALATVEELGNLGFDHDALRNQIAGLTGMNHNLPQLADAITNIEAHMQIVAHFSTCCRESEKTLDGLLARAGLNPPDTVMENINRYREHLGKLMTLKSNPDSLSMPDWQKAYKMHAGALEGLGRKIRVELNEIAKAKLPGELQVVGQRLH